MRTWLKKIIGEHGQGIVEYALLLAFVVGCAAALFSNSGLAGGIKQTFLQVADTLEGIQLPKIDESDYTDEEKQDKQSMDDIARAVEKAIRNGDIIFSDGYPA
ncbi:Flp family type IVb pilin [Mitsuokella sp. WILCCON 0060]|uniref:Flp family type IVb pilin n=1 Tax=Mitsuokella sp. WILCCON 0060 TaxID=3345341 RepID=UPI003F1B53D0